MFESAEVGHALDKRKFARIEPRLRQDLLEAQYALLRQGRYQVIVLVNGVDGAGKGETVNVFNEWMDPRHIHTHAFGPESDEERDRPEMWKFWRALPPRGRIGILFGSWYSDPILQRVMGSEKRTRFEHRLERIRRFERMLIDEGAALVKLWFHLSKKAQARRLKELASSSKTAWRIGPGEWKRFKHYDEFVSVCDVALRETSTDAAPWHIVEGSDPGYRSVTAGRLLLEALRGRAALREPRRPARRAARARGPEPTPLDARNVLRSLDYGAGLARSRYEKRMQTLQARLNGLTRARAMKDHAVVLVFEGMDAAGKGSTIRRVTRAMDARFYRVVPVAAPSDEERAQPYLWRFWRHLPRRGRCVIFDRSWYGRVLVERVEGFCAPGDWGRAYHEINEFEEELTESGGIVVKVWLSITLDEQLKRFRERERTPYKRFKITAEDWRNRSRWPLYERAVCDMVDRTSTDHAPWRLVAANDKYHARVEVLETICGAIERRLKA